jgi:hypothetical protein
VSEGEGDFVLALGAEDALDAALVRPAVLVRHLDRE